MTNNKLPAYFEKYFEGKFGGVDISISELKTHVNDEIKLISEEMKSFRKQLIVIWISLVVLLLLHIESFGPTFLNGLKAFIGI
jgi:hypothetical protein